MVCSLTELTSRILSAGGQDCILEPLCFPEQLTASITVSSTDSSCLVYCVLCSRTAPLSDKDQLLKHLLLEHKLVIADIKLVADFAKYDRDSAWRQAFQTNLIIKAEGYQHEYFSQNALIFSTFLGDREKSDPCGFKPIKCIRRGKKNISVVPRLYRIGLLTVR